MITLGSVYVWLNIIPLSRGIICNMRVFARALIGDMKRLASPLIGNMMGCANPSIGKTITLGSVCIWLNTMPLSRGIVCNMLGPVSPRIRGPIRPRIWQ